MHWNMNLSKNASPRGGGGGGGGAAGGGGGGTLIFSNIRRLGPFFGFKNLEFQYFLVSSENEYFLGYEDFVDIFWGSSQNLASLRVISMQFRVFFKVTVQNWDIFCVAKISNNFLGCLKFLIFFWCER